MKRILIAAFLFALPAVVFAQVIDAGRYKRNIENDIDISATIIADGDDNLRLPPRTNTPLACIRQLAGVTYYNIGSAFFCYCRWDGATAAWHQLHSPGTTTGCGNR